MEIRDKPGGDVHHPWEELDEVRSRQCGVGNPRGTFNDLDDLGIVVPNDGLLIVEHRHDVRTRSPLKMLAPLVWITHNLRG